MAFCQRLRPFDRTNALMHAFVACNAYNICMQYTIRNVPATLDEALRRAAHEQAKA
jgi:hypothetical protein